jgi:hypothetical protein
MMMVVVMRGRVGRKKSGGEDKRKRVINSFQQLVFVRRIMMGSPPGVFTDHSLSSMYLA